MANLQAEHNKEMEKKYSADQNHEKASMQQQYAHGIFFVLNVMAQFENMHKDGVALFLSPWNGKTERCFKSPKLLRALRALNYAMKGGRLPRNLPMLRKETR